MSVWRRAITVVAWFFAWFFLWAHPPCSLAQEGARAVTREVTESIQIPARPELLHFEDSVYPAPRGEDYRHTLSNGLTVYVVEDHSVPIVDVTMALPVGEFLDPPGQVGLASLAALLVRRVSAVH